MMIMLGISWYSGKRSTSSFEKSRLPCTTTSNTPLLPGMSSASTLSAPNCAFSSATRPVAWGA